MIIVILLYKWGIRGTERLTMFPKITQPITEYHDLNAGSLSPDSVIATIAVNYLLGKMERDSFRQRHSRTP